MSELGPIIDRLEAIDDPLDRAVAAQKVITAFVEVRDTAMRQAWHARRAGTSVASLARHIGVTRTAAAIAVSKSHTLES